MRLTVQKRGGGTAEWNSRSLIWGDTDIHPLITVINSKGECWVENVSLSTTHGRSYLGANTRSLGSTILPLTTVLNIQPLLFFDVQRCTPSFLRPQSPGGHHIQGKLHPDNVQIGRVYLLSQLVMRQLEKQACNYAKCYCVCI